MSFEKVLKFANEVEKGSHIKPATIPEFRPDALKAFCAVVQENLEKLEPEPEDGNDDQDDENSWDDEEDAGEEENDENAVLRGDEADSSCRKAPNYLAKTEKRKKMTKEQILKMEADELAREQHKHKDLIRKVYRSSEVQFKSRLQLFVHQYRQKEKKARKG